jgi:hypothetical protein
MVSLVHTGNFTSIHVEDSRSFNTISVPPSTGSVMRTNVNNYHFVKAVITILMLMYDQKRISKFHFNILLCSYQDLGTSIQPEHSAGESLPSSFTMLMG